MWFQNRRAKFRKTERLNQQSQSNNNSKDNNSDSASTSSNSHRASSPNNNDSKVDDIDIKKENSLHMRNSSDLDGKFLKPESCNLQSNK